MSNHPTAGKRRARANLALTNKALAQQIAAQLAIRVSVPKSAHFGDDPAVKSALDKWSLTTDQLVAAGTTVADLEKSLVAARGAHAALTGGFQLNAGNFASTLTHAVEGDADAIKSFGLQATTRVVVVRDNVAPANVRARHGETAGEYLVRWNAQGGAGAYELQVSSSDSSADASYATVYVGKQARFAAVGQVGQGLSLRVRTIGLGATPSPWSAPIVFTVR